MDLRIAVTPKGYDDIGAVIHKLEYPFENLSENDLANAGKLSAYDVVFINCSGSCDAHAQSAGKSLEKYVAVGGTVYASDFASGLMAAAFPKAIAFAGRSGASGLVTADVRDKGLRGVLGEKVQLHFDLGAWEQIASVGADTQVHVELSGKPLLVSFRHGKGQVIYTCFHNHAQVSKQEADLLRYLVLKPLTARVSAELASFDWGDQDELQETVATVTVNAETPWYDYDLKHAGPLMVMLNWQGDARLALEVQGPTGSLRQESAHPPVTVNEPQAAAGRWRYRAVAQEVAVKNFPFVILIGPAGQVASRGSAAPPVPAAPPVIVDLTVLAAINILDTAPAPPPVQDFEIRILDSPGPESGSN